MADKKSTAKPTAAESKDLPATLSEQQADLSQAIRSHKAGELVNPRVITQLRRDIARTKTAMRANEIGKEK